VVISNLETTTKKNKGNNKMKYFENCKDLQEVYKTYKILVKKYHPDISGQDTLKEMQEINNQLAFIKDKSLEQYLKKDNDKNFAKVFTDLQAKKDSPLAQLLVFGINKELEMEFVGFWLWISGNTKEHKGKLKELGAKFSGKHKKWYYTNDTKKVRGSKLSYTEIQLKYGVEKVKANFKRLAA
jgi:curved DNA-binding protein CbpA